MTPIEKILFIFGGLLILYVVFNLLICPCKKLEDSNILKHSKKETFNSYKITSTEGQTAFSQYINSVCNTITSRIISTLNLQTTSDATSFTVSTPYSLVSYNVNENMYYLYSNGLFQDPTSLPKPGFHSIAGVNSGGLFRFAYLVDPCPPYIGPNGIIYQGEEIRSNNNCVAKTINDQTDPIPPTAICPSDTSFVIRSLNGNVTCSNQYQRDLINYSFPCPDGYSWTVDNWDLKCKRDLVRKQPNLVCNGGYALCGELAKQCYPNKQGYNKGTYCNQYIPQYGVNPPYLLSADRTCTGRQKIDGYCYDLPFNQTSWTKKNELWYANPIDIPTKGYSNILYCGAYAKHMIIPPVTIKIKPLAKTIIQSCNSNPNLPFDFNIVSDNLSASGYSLNVKSGYIDINLQKIFLNLSESWFNTKFNMYVKGVLNINIPVEINPVTPRGVLAINGATFKMYILNSTNALQTQIVDFTVIKTVILLIKSFILRVINTIQSALVVSGSDGCGASGTLASIIKFNTCANTIKDTVLGNGVGMDIQLTNIDPLANYITELISSKITGDNSFNPTETFLPSVTSTKQLRLTIDGVEEDSPFFGWNSLGPTSLFFNKLSESGAMTDIMTLSIIDSIYSEYEDYQEFTESFIALTSGLRAANMNPYCLAASVISNLANALICNPIDFAGILIDFNTYVSRNTNANKPIFINIFKIILCKVLTNVGVNVNIGNILTSSVTTPVPLTTPIPSQPPINTTTTTTTSTPTTNQTTTPTSTETSTCRSNYLTSTNIGPACYDKIWKDSGCTTNSNYVTWHSQQTGQALINDSKLWATLTSEQHRQGCYGSDKTKWPVKPVIIETQDITKSASSYLELSKDFLDTGKNIKTVRINGSVTNVITDGKKCAYFNNNLDNYISFPFDNTDYITVSFWYYQLNASYYTIASITNSSLNPILQFDCDGTKIMVYGALPNQWTCQLNSPITINKWNCITLTIDQNTYIVNLYVNGELKATGNGTSRFPNTGSTWFLGRSGDNGRAFNGYISDFIVYNGIMSDTQINSLYYSTIKNLLQPVIVATTNSNTVYYVTKLNLPSPDKRPTDFDIFNFKWTCVSNGKTFGVDNNGNITYSTNNINKISVTRPNTILVQLSFDGYQHVIMGIGSDTSIWYADKNIYSTPNWTRIGGSLTNVAYSNGKAYGCNSNDDIYYASNAAVGNWIQIAGKLICISFDGYNDIIVGCNRTGSCFSSVNNSNWVQMSGGGITNISYSNGRMACVSGGQVFFSQSITNVQWKNIEIGGGFKQVSYDDPNTYKKRNYAQLTSTGTDIGSVISGTLFDCQNTCDNNPECIGFSRAKSVGDNVSSQCYFKKSAPSIIFNQPTWNTYVKPSKSSSWPRQAVNANNGSVSCNTYCNGNEGKSWNNELPSNWNGATCVSTNNDNIGCDSIAGSPIQCICEPKATEWNGASYMRTGTQTRSDTYWKGCCCTRWGCCGCKTPDYTDMGCHCYGSNVCPVDTEKIGNMCYPKCQSGWRSSGGAKCLKNV